MPNVDSLRYVVVGVAAGIQHAHRRAQLAEGIHVVAASDIRTEPGKARAAEIGCAFYEDYRVMLAETRPDVAVIVTPHPSHPGIAIDCMRAGCHVLDAQMSRGAVHQYHLYGLFPIGDTVRRSGWWYHTDIATKKRWFGEPWGGPDTHLARPYFVKTLEERVAEMTRWANDPKTDMVKQVGTEKTREQIVPIMDGLINNNEGIFQVNVPNHGALAGLPDDLVVEVPAIVNQKGIQPLCVGALPPKIMFECILPDWLETERALLAFKTGDRSILLYDVLNHHQTKSYDQAVAILDELMELDEVKQVEDWERMKRISEHFEYPRKARVFSQ